MADLPATNLTMLTEVRSEGALELFLEALPMPDVKPHEVLVQVEATPINPSDLGLMFGPVDTAVASQTTRNGMPSITVPVSAPAMRAMAGRMDEALPIGNEGCGTVVKAGDSPEAQALLGKRVALLGGAVYAAYRALPAMMCMPLPDGTDAKDGASCFVNPLTALSFTETMKLEGHSAIIHTAAASNLGQMLVKICKADGIPLINIVRSDAQVAILKAIGATHILNSAADDFQEQLVAAIIETGATIAFDAIGGGKLPSQILAAMEIAAVKRMKDYSRYGSDTFKQIYLYGMLDPSPTTLSRSFGFNWACSGWLLTPWLGKLGSDISNKMRARIVAELTTTFASHYSHEVTLEQSLDLGTAQAYNAKRTGEKYLIRP